MCTGWCSGCASRVVPRCHSASIPTIVTAGRDGVATAGANVGATGSMHVFPAAAAQQPSQLQSLPRPLVQMLVQLRLRRQLGPSCMVLVLPLVLSAYRKREFSYPLLDTEDLYAIGHVAEDTCLKVRTHLSGVIGPLPLFALPTFCRCRKLEKKQMAALFKHRLRETRVRSWGRALVVISFLSAFLITFCVL